MGEQDLGGVTHSYQDGEGFPWGLLVPLKWTPPAETQRIEVHYPRFANWRQSFGAEHTDWYLHYDDPYVPPPDDIVAEESQVTFSRRAGIQSPPGQRRHGRSGRVHFPGTAVRWQLHRRYPTIQRYDSATKAWGSPVLISSSATDDKFNDVSGSRIVYTAFDGAELDARTS